MNNSTSTESIFVLNTETRLNIVMELQKIMAILVVSITLPMSILGVISNLLIMIAIPRCKSVPRNAKLYYVAIAIFDFLLTIQFHILTVLPWGISKFTNKQIFISSFESINSTTCSINRTLLRIWVGSSSGITLAFAVEKALVIKFPFHARKLTFGKNLILICGIILFSCIGGLLTSRSQYLMKQQGLVYDGLCTNREEIYFIIINLSGDTMIFILPNILTFTITSFIMKMLSEKFKARRQLVHQNSVSISNSELTTIKILLFMAFFRCIQLFSVAPLMFLTTVSRIFNEINVLIQIFSVF